MKKILAFILVGILLLVTACSSGTPTEPTGEPGQQSETSDDETVDSKTTDETPSNPGAADVYAKYDPVIEMEAVRNVQLADTEVDFSKSIWVQEYEETLGIKLSYKLQAYGEQYENKVNMLLASGDLPDVMQVNLRQLYQMIEADQVQDLKPVWDAFATEQTKKAMTADGTQNFDVASVDGKLYAIPSVDPAIETAHCLFIREDWRKKLNLPEPKTFEDFEKIIYAFAEQDPNGNGQKDEFGISLNKNLFTHSHDVTTFFNCFGAFPDAWIEDENGNLVYGGILPGMKPALEKLQQYYKDGLIDKEFTVKDEPKAAENVVKEVMGAYFGIQWAGFVGDAIISLYKNTDGNSEWKSYPIPAATEDGMPIMYNTTSKFYVVTKGYEHPEALVKMVSYIHHLGIGPQNEGPWATDEEKYDELWGAWEEALICPETIHDNVNRWIAVFDAYETGDTTEVDWSYLRRGVYDGYVEWKKNGRNFRDVDTGEPSFDGAAAWSNLEICAQTFMNTLAARDAGKLQADKLGSFVSPTMLEKQATLDKLELETITRIITGELPIDEFDKFVEQWKALGGDQITKEINDWYKSIQ